MSACAHIGACKCAQSPLAHWLAGEWRTSCSKERGSRRAARAPRQRGATLNAKLFFSRAINSLGRPRGGRTDAIDRCNCGPLAQTQSDRAISKTTFVLASYSISALDESPASELAPRRHRRRCAGPFASLSAHRQRGLSARLTTSSASGKKIYFKRKLARAPGQTGVGRRAVLARAKICRR